MSYKHGKDGHALYGGERVEIKNWNGTLKKVKVITTDSGSGGWQTILPEGGQKSMDGAVTMHLDKQKHPHASPINFWANDDLVPLTLVAHDGLKYSFDAFLETLDITVETNDEQAITISVPYASSGPVVITTG